MSASPDAKLAALHEHYEGTCTWVRDRTGARERLMIAILIILGIQYFQVEDPSETTHAFVSAFKETIDLKVLANVHALNTLVWFLLLATVMRYYQINIYINRQYIYLHKLEADFKSEFGVNFINREGQAYLKDYPWFSNWTHVLYAWVFPVLLLIAITVKILADWNGSGSTIGSFGVSCLIFGMIVLSTILYLGFLHLKKRD